MAVRSKKVSGAERRSEQNAERQQTKRVNKALESVISREICDWLELGDYFFWRSNNVPVFAMSNDGVRRFRALPKHTPRGLPDIIVIHQGKFIALEVKRPGAKLRPEQGEFGVKCALRGGYYYVVHSLAEVRDLREFGGTLQAHPARQRTKEEIANAHA